MWDIGPSVKMNQKRPEGLLSERAVAFSVDALLGHFKQPRTSSAHQKDETPQDDDTTLKCDDESENALLVQPMAAKRRKATDVSTKEEISVELEGEELWSQFHRLGNEMIITKSGRRIFPALKVKVRGLDPDSNYILWVDIVPVDNLRYRYVYHSSQWMVAGTGETPLPHAAYLHPDSPSTGRHWDSQTVAFDKLKLTNCKIPTAKGQVSLHSMHKYQPRVHIQKTLCPNLDPEHQMDMEHSMTFAFPETQFITVTAYQNQQITRLKIASNPFAKGFREIVKNSRKAADIPSARHHSAFLPRFHDMLTSSLRDSSIERNEMPYPFNVGLSMSSTTAYFPPVTSIHPMFTNLTGTNHTHRTNDCNTLMLRPNYFPYKFCQGQNSPCSHPYKLTPDVMHNSDSIAHTGIGWKPFKEECKPTARVAPCVMVPATTTSYTDSIRMNRDFVSTWLPHKDS